MASKLKQRSDGLKVSFRAGLGVLWYVSRADRRRRPLVGRGFRTNQGGAGLGGKRGLEHKSPRKEGPEEGPLKSPRTDWQETDRDPASCQSCVFLCYKKQGMQRLHRLSRLDRTMTRSRCRYSTTLLFLCGSHILHEKSLCGCVQKQKQNY